MRRYSRCLAFAAGGRPKAEAKRFVRVALHHRRMARLLTEKMREMQTESRRSDGGGYGEG